MSEINDTAIDQWETTYKPRQNHLDPNASWNGLMYETHGAEWEFVKSQPNNNVWTWVDSDDGSSLISGMHFVNRIGYFICEQQWTTMDEWVKVEDGQFPCEVCLKPIEDCICSYPHKHKKEEPNGS